MESTDGFTTDDDGALVDPDQPGKDSGASRASVSAAMMSVLGAATAFSISLG